MLVLVGGRLGSRPASKRRKGRKTNHKEGQSPIFLSLQPSLYNVAPSPTPLSHQPARLRNGHPCHTIITTSTLDHHHQRLRLPPPQRTHHRRIQLQLHLPCQQQQRNASSARIQLGHPRGLPRRRTRATDPLLPRQGRDKRRLGGAITVFGPMVQSEGDRSVSNGYWCMYLPLPHLPPPSLPPA